MTSATFKQAAFAAETSEVFIVLITLTNSQLPIPVRVCSNSVDITSRGEVFKAAPFELSLPADDPERPPRAFLRIDNVSTEIVRAVRSASTPINILIEIVLASNPDVVEISLPDLRLIVVDYDLFSVSGDLVMENFLREPFPSARFTPGQFPGIF